MSKIKLYIAASIDGFIGRLNGDLDWLDNIDNPTQTDHGYNAFLSGVSTTIMGSKTYEKIVGFDIVFPYAHLTNYVATRRSDLKTETPNTYLLHSLHREDIERIKQEAVKDIWLIGGGEIVTTFLNMNLIDEMIICVAPVILGEGIPLFASKPNESVWQLVKTETFDTGIVSLTYTK